MKKKMAPAAERFPLEEALQLLGDGEIYLQATDRIFPNTKRTEDLKIERVYPNRIRLRVIKNVFFPSENSKPPERLKSIEGYIVSLNISYASDTHRIKRLEEVVYIEVVDNHTRKEGEAQEEEYRILTKVVLNLKEGRIDEMELIVDYSNPSEKSSYLCLNFGSQLGVESYMGPTFRSRKGLLAALFFTSVGFEDVRNSILENMILRRRGYF